MGIQSLTQCLIHAVRDLVRKTMMDAPTLITAIAKRAVRRQATKATIPASTPAN